MPRAFELDIVSLELCGKILAILAILGISSSSVLAVYKQVSANLADAVTKRKGGGGGDICVNAVPVKRVIVAGLPHGRVMGALIVTSLIVPDGNSV